MRQLLSHFGLPELLSGPFHVVSCSAFMLILIVTGYCAVSAPRDVRVISLPAAPVPDIELIRLVANQAARRQGTNVPPHPRHLA